jgi:hypothetical protein
MHRLERETDDLEEASHITAPKQLAASQFRLPPYRGGYMKKSVLSVIAISSLLISSMVVLAGTNVQDRIRADIPFDFVVGSARMSAGQYTIQRGTSHSSLKLSCDKSSVIALTFSGSSSKTPSHAKLVFHKYGDQYFLAQVWDEGSTTADNLMATRTEREAARTSGRLARNDAGPEVVVIAAL